LANKINRISEQIIERASRIFLVLSGVLILLMSLLTSYGVIRRYAFDNPEPYSYEFNMMFLVLCFVLAVPAVDRLSRHIRVDIIPTHLPQRAQDILLNIVGPIIGLVFCVVLVWKGWTDAWYALQIGQKSSSAWAAPLFPTKIIIPIGYGLLCLVLVARLWSGITSLKDSTTK
jgi:TRAP-type C4-dicarboxylate transport system permease small subunit